jgi:hypothetical protein
MWQEAYSTAVGDPDAGYIKAMEKSTYVVNGFS